MKSIWKQTTSPKPREALSRDITAEAAVIGGGMAGCLTALLLQQHGIETVVLEADRIGSGQTGGTTAKITAQHGLHCTKLIRDFGLEKARQYVRANQQAIGMYREIVRRHHIDCGFREAPAVLYSAFQIDQLREEETAARQLGIDTVFTTETELPFPVSGALRMERQAQFHPLQFLEAIADRLQIYEQTRAVRVQGNTIRTERGNVTAKHIIFASHFPVVTLQGAYPLRLHQERSYVLALEEAPPLRGMYFGIDPGGLSLRTHDRFLLLGGGGHRTGKAAGDSYAILRQQAARFWPDSREAAHWSAQDCMPLDGVPYIGRLCLSAPNRYVATGFQKWGMTSSMVAAVRISDLICGTHTMAHDIFSPQRFPVSASANQLGSNALESAKGLGRTCFSRPKRSVAAVARGEGAIVMRKGKKIGVYRDEHGNIFPVSVRCPHLGCALAWNPAERSWDCPCHGSRFDIYGNLLDNPAQTDIALP